MVVEVVILFVGFALGLISSWLFWRWQLTLAPKYQVSDKIAVGASRRFPGQPTLQIKLVNRSRRSMINVTARCSVQEIRTTDKGAGRILLYTVNLQPSAETYIGPAVRKYDPWSITAVHYYNSDPEPKVFDLLEEKSDSRRVLLTIQATDAQSGTTTLQRFTYTRNDLVQGHFESRKGLNIIAKETNMEGEF